MRGLPKVRFLEFYVGTGKSLDTLLPPVLCWWCAMKMINSVVGLCGSICKQTCSLSWLVPDNWTLNSMLDALLQVLQKCLIVKRIRLSGCLYLSYFFVSFFDFDICGSWWLTQVFAEQKIFILYFCDFQICCGTTSCTAWKNVVQFLGSIDWWWLLQKIWRLRCYCTANKNVRNWDSV